MQRGRVKSQKRGFKRNSRRPKAAGGPAGEPAWRLSASSSRHGIILWVSGFAVFMVILGGCGPELSKSDLGTVVFEVPKVAGADQPYAMPQLGPPVERDDKNFNRPLR